MNGAWYVFDPNPVLEDESGPKLYGTFPTEDAAFEFANVMHPEDGNGNAVVLQLERVNNDE